MPHGQSPRGSRQAGSVPFVPGGGGGKKNMPTPTGRPREVTRKGGPAKRKSVTHIPRKGGKREAGRKM